VAATTREETPVVEVASSAIALPTMEVRLFLISRRYKRLFQQQQQGFWWRLLQLLLDQQLEYSIDLI